MRCLARLFLAAPVCTFMVGCPPASGPAGDATGENQAVPSRVIFPKPR